MDEVKVTWEEPPRDWGWSDHEHHDDTAQGRYALGAAEEQPHAESVFHGACGGQSVDNDFKLRVTVRKAGMARAQPPYPCQSQGDQ